MNSLKNKDTQNNMHLDINSLMAAFDEYITGIQEKKEHKGEYHTGIPIGYQMRPFSKEHIIEAYMKKYFYGSISDESPNSKLQPLNSNEN